MVSGGGGGGEAGEGDEDGGGGEGGECCISPSYYKPTAPTHCTHALHPP
jgi:hypothetical protein